MKWIVWFSCLFLFSCKSESDVKLSNKWQLESYVKNESSLVKNVPGFIYFTFMKDNTISVDLDLNTCFGLYTKSSKTLILTDFSCSEICCDSTIYLNAFELFTDSIRTYHINGETLKLKGKYGTTMQLTLVK